MPALCPTAPPSLLRSAQRPGPGDGAHARRSGEVQQPRDQQVRDQATAVPLREKNNYCIPKGLTIFSQL